MLLKVKKYLLKLEALCWLKKWCNAFFEINIRENGGRFMRFIYGKNDWKDAESGEQTCYLLTNALGGFSSLAINGACARNDHGLFIASLKAPTERYHMVSNIHEKVIIEDKEYGFSSQRYVNCTKNSFGARYLQSFEMEYLPHWSYMVSGIDIDKTIVMLQDVNTVAVKYEIDSPKNATLELTPWFQFVQKGHLLSLEQKIEMDDKKISSNGIDMYYYTNARVSCLDENVYENDRYYAADAIDGRDAYGCAVSNHKLICDIKAGKQVYYVVYSISEIMGEKVDERWVDSAICNDIERQQRLEETSKIESPVGRVLARSANQYLTLRESTNSMSIMAGFPFFADWGRDTMIAMMGCTLATEQYGIAADVLRTFAKYCRRGIMPNMFPEEDCEPMYNTVDASLLYIEAVYKYFELTGDIALVNELWPVMNEIISFYKNGTDYNIHMDEDGLIIAGEEFYQLTWMDVRIGNYLPTPRHGKPVEINAYWYNALRIMAELSDKVDKNIEKVMSADELLELSDKVKDSFIEKFWWQEKGFLRDVISEENYETNNPSEQIRCNQIWALTMSYTMLDKKQAQAVIETVYRELYTPLGLRSLSPEDSQYHAVYGGSQYERDMAYHQGTVWMYPLGAFYLAYLRWSDDRKEAVRWVNSKLVSMEAALREGCIGHLAEIYDGEVPDSSKGCFAQAWSVGEIVRVYKELER